MLSILGFDRIYHFFPERLMISLGLTVAIFIVLSAYALRGLSSGKPQTSPYALWVTAFAGGGVTYFATGPYLVAGLGILIFPGMFAVAAIFVTINLGQAELSRKRILIHAAVSSIVFLVPGVLSVLPLHTTTIYQPATSILAFSGATLGLLHAAVAFSGLARIILEAGEARVVC